MKLASFEADSVKCNSMIKTWTVTMCKGLLLLFLPLWQMPLWHQVTIATAIIYGIISLCILIDYNQLHDTEYFNCSPFSLFQRYNYYKVSLIDWCLKMSHAGDMFSLFQLMADQKKTRSTGDKLHILCPEGAGGHRKWSVSRHHCFFSYRLVYLKKVCSRLLRSRIMMMMDCFTKSNSFLCNSLKFSLSFWSNFGDTLTKSNKATIYLQLGKYRFLPMSLWMTPWWRVGNQVSWGTYQEVKESVKKTK